MSLKRNIALGIAAAAVAATSVFAASHSPGPAEKAIKARQSHMQLNLFNISILGAMAKGDVDFDAGAAQAAADNLVALSSMNLTAYWLPESSSMDMDNTAALPDIWDNIPDVISKAEALNAAAVVVQAAAGSLDGVRSTLGGLGGACGACHKLYRQPSN